MDPTAAGLAAVPAFVRPLSILNVFVKWPSCPSLTGRSADESEKAKIPSLWQVCQIRMGHNAEAQPVAATPTVVSPGAQPGAYGYTFQGLKFEDFLSSGPDPGCRDPAAGAISICTTRATALHEVANSKGLDFTVFGPYGLRLLCKQWQIELEEPSWK